jgi:polyhydroxybutyrate depolymerase
MVGTKDPVIPLNGGASKLSIWGNRKTPPVMDTVTLWANASGCPSRPMTIDPQRNVKILRFEPCKNNTEFLVYFIQGQGHNWPGGNTRLKESIIGPNINTINATDVIWSFFKKQVR